MKTIEYRYVDKTSWERGEWDHEPDKIQFQDEDTGLPCLIVRGRSGALCGYVGVSPNHPFYRQDYDKCNVEAHGGLTFAGFCHENEENHGICHLPDEGEEKKVWWLSFDCAHAGDFCPSYTRFESMPFRRSYDETYKNINYVKQQVKWLARQISSPDCRVLEGLC